MKRVFILGIMLILCTAFVSADSINLGEFPVGKWLDAKWNATWSFMTNNIQIIDSSGKVVYDFAGKTINDFKVTLSGGAPTISFSCVESGRSYSFAKPLTNTEVKMTITRTNGDKYETTMKKQ